MVNEVIHIVTVMGDHTPNTHPSPTTLNSFFKYFYGALRTHPIIYFDSLEYNNNVKDDDNKIKFWTSDYMPIHDLKKISEKFPDLTLRVEYADEDLGINVGVYYLENGEMVDYKIPEPLSVDAYEMSMDITGDKYYITGFIETLNKSDSDEEFPQICIEMAYNRRAFTKKFPTYILEHFEKLAVRDEDYEYASTIVKEIKSRCQNT